MRENRMRRTPKVSDGRSIRVGLVGPKPRPEGVGDGQQVNSPVPTGRSEGGTPRGKPASGWREVPSGEGEEGLEKSQPGTRPVKAEPTGHKWLIPAAKKSL